MMPAPYSTRKPGWREHGNGEQAARPAGLRWAQSWSLKGTPTLRNLKGKQAGAAQHPPGDRGLLALT